MVRSNVDSHGEEVKQWVPPDPSTLAGDDALAALSTQAQFSYGEGCDMLQHALQCASIARSGGCSDEDVIACLFHDVGNTKQARDAWCQHGHAAPSMLLATDGAEIGYEKHAEVGAHYLRCLGFSEAVCNAVASHIDAKRYLVATDASYNDRLSEASKQTLIHQGGPMSHDEQTLFRSRPGWETALRLRLWDEAGKMPGTELAPGDYRDLVVKHLHGQHSVTNDQGS